MAPTDGKPSDFERRASTRISRTLSIHADGNGAGTVDGDDDDFNIMALTVADGFRPSEHSHGISSFSPGSTYSNPTSGSDSRLSFSSIESPTSQHRSSIAAETASISDADSASAPASAPTPNASDLADSSDSSGSSDSSDSSDPSTASPSVAYSPQPTAPSKVELHEAAAAAAAAAAQPTPPTAPGGISNRPSSITKLPIGSSSLGSSSGAGSSSAAHASEHASSSMPVVQGEEPYQGPSGPSFPYQLYPQNVRIARTLSGITTATAAPSESSYNGPRGPTFPYSLYPQSTMAGSGAVPTSAIPVGFPGMADGYQRRLGPDGEDIADMIGPDGHTEQLPPYSRYPDNYSGKMAAVMAAVPPAPVNAAGVVGVVDVAGVAGVADVAGVAGVAGASGTVSALSAVGTVGAATTAADAAAAAGSAAETSAAADAASEPNIAPGAVPVAVPDLAPAAGSDQAATTATAAATTTETTTATATAAAATTAVAAAPNIRPIPGAGGIGLAPRNPEFDSAEDLDSPQSRHSSRSFTSDASQNEINAAGTVYNEKRLSPRLRQLARRRLFGVIPYWAICLAIIALVIMCIVLGSVIGVLLTRHHKPPPHTSTATTGAVTVTVDATPIPTPTNLIALPTGTYSLPLTLNKSPNSCFNDTTQSATWNCNVWYMAGMTVDISSQVSNAGNISYGMSISCNVSETLTSDIFWYGEQPPVIPTATSLLLVNDTADLTRGPAWFTMMPYNKTVIVPESLLTAPTAVVTADVQGATVETKMKVRRQRLEQLTGRDRGPGPNHAFGVAQAGDKPWVCTWPDTMLEVFIYPNQNTSWSNLDSSSIKGTYSTTPTPTSASTGGATSLGNLGRLGNFGSLGSLGSGTQATTQTGVVATATTALPASMLPVPFPRVVKLEERRMAGSLEATCVQYQLKPAGTGVTAVPNLDGNGKRIEVTIAEIESANEYSRRDVSGESRESLLGRRDLSDLSDCGCLWIVS